MKIDYARILRMMRPSRGKGRGWGSVRGREWGKGNVVAVAVSAAGVGSSRGVKNPPNLI